MPFFLFVVFVVYTLLPFSTRGAVAVGVVSTVSHLLVCAALMGAFTTPSVWMGLQVRGRGGGEGRGGSGGGRVAFASGQSRGGMSCTPRPWGHADGWTAAQNFPGQGSVPLALLC